MYVFIRVIIIIIFLPLYFLKWVYESRQAQFLLAILKRKLWYLSPPSEGPTGSRNPSTVCYINSMIQAVASSSVFIKECQKYSNCVSLNHFCDLVTGVNTSGNLQENIDTNSKITEKLISSIGWKKPLQQDAYELFAALIKAIHDQLTETAPNSFQIPMKIKLVHRFTGMDIPDKVQDHLGLSVGLCGDYFVRSGVSLEYLINKHFSPTIIDDDSSKTTQMFFYQQAPDVLLIHIQANKWNQERGEMVKPEYYITYKTCETFCFKIVTDLGSKEITESNEKYNLKAIVRHMGGISGGHYVTYRIYKNKWFLISDEFVKETNFSNKVIPYIMIYEKTKEDKE